MSENRLLSIFQIMEELNTGKATTKFILRRFSHLISCVESDGQTMYPVESLKIISILFERFQSGDLPSEIEDQPDLDGFSSQDALQVSFDDIQGAEKNKVADPLASILEKISSQQEKIIFCLEKQSEILRNISSVIDKTSGFSGNMQIEFNDPQVNMPLDQSFESAKDEMIDDLSMLVEDDRETDKNLAEISLDDTDIGETDNDETDHIEQTDMDDLSLLLDAQTKPDSSEDRLDDLWALVETGPPVSDNEKNDVSETDKPDAPEDLDNLWMLLDEQPGIENDSPLKDMDDLSLLVDEESVLSGNEVDTAEPPEPESTDMDDLSALIDVDDFKSADSDDPVETDGSPAEIDNLYQLTDNEPEEDKKDSDNSRQITIDADPDDTETYKAAIMETILRLKEEGRSVDDAVMLLNQSQIQTLSGKPEWSEKAISQIYTFIDSAA